jgi:hypothetical protein
MSNILIIFLYCLAAYGLSNMVVFGSGPFRIFEHLRNISSGISPHFGTLFSCMMCFPANVGLIVSAIDWFLIPSIALTPFNICLIGTNLWWLALLADCCFTSGMVWIIHNIESFFESIANGTASNQVDDDNNDIIQLHD